MSNRLNVWMGLLDARPAAIRGGGVTPVAVYFLYVFQVLAAEAALRTLWVSKN